MSKVNKKPMLDSWKEIADFLNKDIRTCQRWERELGLPIHRLEGPTKARVFSYPEEIEVWLEKKYKKRAENNLKSQVFLFGKLKYLLLPIALVVLTVTALLLVIFKPAPEPVGFIIQGSRLIILDIKGKQIWDYDTGIENLETDEYYKLHYQLKTFSIPDGIGYTQPHIMFADLDHNGSRELLFSIQTKDEVNEGKLFCFNSRGKILWTYDSGQQLQFGGKSYSQAFRIHGIRIKDWDKNGKDEILLVSKHLYRFPCQVTLLDYNGIKKGEYWHSGYLADYEFIDLDGNGKCEILLAGTNNEWSTPVCVVLDPADLKGASRQKENEYILQNMEAGAELFYLRFPRNEVNRLTSINDSFCQINILDRKNKIVLASQQSCVIFTLDFNLSLEKIVLTHRFKMAYYRLLSEGKINSSLEQIEQDILAQGIEYILPPDLTPSNHKP